MQQFETRYGRVVSFDLESCYGEIHLDTAPEQKLPFHSTYYHSLLRPTRYPRVGAFVEVIRDAKTKESTAVREVSEEAYKKALAEDRAKFGAYTKARLDEALDLIERLKKEHEAQTAIASATWKKISDLRDEVKKLCLHDEQIFERIITHEDTYGTRQFETRRYDCAICGEQVAVYYSDSYGHVSQNEQATYEKANRWRAEGRITETKWGY